MKSRLQELTDKSIAAMVSAIEIYNKPDFKYREETFSILAINAWELLLKAKWLKDNNNAIHSLYVLEIRKKPNGKPYKKSGIKRTSCGNPFTHSLDYLATRMAEKKTLADLAHKNIIALCEIRDSSVHFYNRNNLFAIRLQEIGSASVKNYVKASQEWFNTDFSNYNFYLMPLAFMSQANQTTAVLLSKEEKKLASFISGLEAANDPTNEYAVSVNIELKFSKSKADDALRIQITNDPTAPKMQFSEDQLKDKFPLIYNALTNECASRYKDFVINQRYHGLRKPLENDKKYCYIKQLDADNPKSAKQKRYSRSIFTVLDQHYSKRS